MSHRNDTSPHPHLWSASGRIAAVLALQAAAGCADSRLIDRTLGGGAELPAATSEPDLIRRATGENTEWPNLASVPPRPEDYRTPAERQALLDRLRSDRRVSIEAGTDLNARAPVAPARQSPRNLPAMGGAVPPPASAIELPETPPAAP
jgi:hypothetical protein